MAEEKPTRWVFVLRCHDYDVALAEAESEAAAMEAWQSGPPSPFDPMEMALKGGGPVETICATVGWAYKLEYPSIVRVTDSRSPAHANWCGELTPSALHALLPPAGAFSLQPGDRAYGHVARVGLRRYTLTRSSGGSRGWRFAADDGWVSGAATGATPELALNALVDELRRLADQLRLDHAGEVDDA